MVPAGVAHLFAGLAASTFAALDDYGTAALGYAAGSAAGLAYILTRDRRGRDRRRVGGMALTARVGLLVPLIALAWRAQRTSMPASARAARGRAAPAAPRDVRRGGGDTAVAAARVRRVGAVRRRARVGRGDELRLRLSRLRDARWHHRVLDRPRLVRPAVARRARRPRPSRATSSRRRGSRSWSSGPRSACLPSPAPSSSRRSSAPPTADEVGEEVGSLVVVLSAWIVVAVGVNVAFPLAFVTGRLRALPWIGVAALAAADPLAWVGVELFELDGLGVSLAFSTLSCSRALLAQLGAAAAASVGLRSRRPSSAAITCCGVRPAGARRSRRDRRRACSASRSYVVLVRR